MLGLVNVTINNNLSSEPQENFLRIWPAVLVEHWHCWIRELSLWNSMIGTVSSAGSIDISVPGMLAETRSQWLEFLCPQRSEQTVAGKSSLQRCPEPPQSADTAHQTHNSCTQILCTRCNRHRDSERKIRSGSLPGTGCCGEGVGITARYCMTEVVGITARYGRSVRGVPCGSPWISYVLKSVRGLVPQLGRRNFQHLCT